MSDSEAAKQLLASRDTARDNLGNTRDLTKLYGSFAQGALATLYNPYYVVVSGEDDDYFGTLTPWDEDKAHQWKIVGFSRALLILEAQELLSTYILQTVQSILAHGLADAVKGDEKWSQLAATGFQGNDDNLRDQHRIVAFGPPPNLSLSRLSETVRMRYDAAKDVSHIGRDTYAKTHANRSSHDRKRGCCKRTLRSRAIC